MTGKGSASVQRIAAAVCAYVCVDDRGLHSLCRMRCLQNTFLIHTKTKAGMHLPSACSQSLWGGLRHCCLISICSVWGDKAPSLAEFLISQAKRIFFTSSFISLCIYMYISVCGGILSIHFFLYMNVSFLCINKFNSLFPLISKFCCLSIISIMWGFFVFVCDLFTGIIKIF